jgi:hypothetical protein
MTERRRLPVLQEPKRPPEPAPPGDPEGDDRERPPWHWVSFGVVAIFAVWLPLAYAAQALSARIVAHTFGDAGQDDVAVRLARMSDAERMRLSLTFALPHVLALALASIAGGFLVGRFGKGTGMREAASAGAGVALLALALSLRSAGVSWSSLVTIVVAVGFAAWGGAFGARSRDAKPV